MHGAVDATHKHTQPARIDVTLDEKDLEAVFWKPASPGDAPALARPRDSSMSMTTATGLRPAKALVQQCSRPRQYPAQRKRTRAIMRPGQQRQRTEDRVQSTDRGSSASESGIRAQGAHHGLRKAREAGPTHRDEEHDAQLLACSSGGPVVNPPACLSASLKQGPSKLAT